MASPNDPGMNDDLSTLAWVYDELRRSLENAHKALHRYLKEAEALGGSDVGSVDPAILRQARAQVHQSIGALELVGLGIAAQPLRAAEAALQRLTAKPKLITADAVRAIEQGSFAVLDFLARRLAGKMVSPLLMFPQYRALQDLAGASRIHPADLWGREWQWHELPADPSAVAREVDAQTMTRVEAELLPLMRGPAPGAAQRMSDLFAGIAAGAADRRAATLWQLAAAYFEAQARGLLPTDVYGKRVASRLLAQLRAGPQADPSDRLAQDLLFFAAQARLDDAHPAGPRLAAARRAFGLEQDTAADYEVARLGRFDPAWLAQARKRVAAAKECWSAVAGGELMRLPGLAEPFTLVGESLNRLYPDGDALAAALQAAVSQTLAAAAEPPAELAMEVATALLYVDASLEDADFDHPEMASRVRRLAQRIEDVSAGREPGPLDRWMEELYRRVSDRQTMGSVVQELRASLSEVEKQIDQYFRNPVQRELLFPVPAQLSAMRGVLSVLGMDQASQAVLRMRDDVDELANTEVDPERAAEIGSFDRLADNLGALSFLIDMVSVQPQLAKSLFRFDPATGNLSAAIARADRNSGFAGLDSAADDAPVLVEQAQSLAEVAAQPDADPEQLTRELERLSQQARAADQPGLAEVASRAHTSLTQAGDDASIESARRQLAESISDFVASNAEPALAIPEPTRPVPPPSPPAAPGDTGLEDDAEMREIFLEEAREVIDNARNALAELQEQPADANAMTTVRRAFHTLKGSSRMVGLKEFGEAGWACEQLYNARLADSGLADANLRGFTAEVLDHFQQWVEAIEQRSDAAFHHAPVSRSADALRLEQRWLPLAASLAGAAPVAQPDAAPPAPAAVAEVLQALAPIEPEPETMPANELPPEFAGAQIEVAEVVDFPPLAEPQIEFTAEPAQADAPAGAFAVQPETAAEAAPAEMLSLELPDLEADVPADLPIDAIEATAATAADGAPAAAFDAEATLTLPTLQDEPPPALQTMVPGLPLAADLELDLPLSLEEAAPAPAAAEADFELQLPDALPLDLVTEPAAAPTQDLIDLPETAEVAVAAPADAAEATLTLPPAELPASAMEAEAALEPDFELRLADEPAEAAVAPPSESAELPELAIDLSEPPIAEAAPVAEADELAAPAPGVTVTERVADDVEVIDVDTEAGADMLAAIAAEAEAEQAPPAVEAISAWAAPDEPRDLAEAAADAEALAEPAAEPAATEVAAFEDDAEQVKVIGPLRIGIPLFNIYLNEADELSRRLATGLAEWALEPQRPVGDAAVALAHSLAGSSATVGYAELSQLARSLEHALMRSNDRGHGRGAEPQVFAESGEEIRRLLHQFAAGFLRSPEPELLRRLQDIEHAPPDAALLGEDGPATPAPLVETAEAAPAALAAADEGQDEAGATTLMGELGLPALMPLAPLPEVVARPSAVRSDALDSDEDIDAVDAIDEELFPIFEEEGQELIPQLQARLRDWGKRPGEPAAASACMRTLHTLKGGARLAGAMRLGEMAHRLETAIEHLLAQPHVEAVDIEPLAARADAMEAHFEALCRGGGVVPAAHVVHEPHPQDAQDSGLEPVLALDSTMEPTLDLLPEPLPDFSAPQVPAAPAPAPLAQPAWAPATAAAPRTIDWSRFEHAAPAAQAEGRAGTSSNQGATVRVRAPLLDRLVNHAGEVSITRARIESDVGQIKGALGDLTDNLERLRRQLRDIELQAESQIVTRMEAARAAAQQFDPLEMDRFTRFQEITRMMAESVNDVATVQRGMQRTLQSAEDELASQARLTRDLQDDLLRTRMVEFEGLSERLYRVVRQAAKETGKQVRLDIIGGSIEIDRGVLDRMTGAFEHLLRNSVAHGIEEPAVRQAAGKDAAGTITVSVTQEGNEVGVDFRDDGAGLNLPRIREKAVAMGLIAADAQPSEGEIAATIFHPGFSTAEQVTGLAGRGVGMDVVRADVNAMGGRIETATAVGQGTSFRLVLPLTTAVTQVVMLRCADLTVAVPSTLVEIVRRMPAAELEPAYRSGHYRFGDHDLPFFWLGALLQGTPIGQAAGRTVPIVVIRSAAQRIALHVDEVLGNQEVVVKNLGPQLSRLPGLTGMTLLPSGAPALIYNPVALASLYGASARAATIAAQDVARREADHVETPTAAEQVPLVLVVDDSLTVRRVTQRLLLREGYRVTLAKDGLEGLECLADELPAVVLTDIEMPRMDGFDLVRNMRVDPRLAGLPVIMITSRIAQKHRDYASELGVNHYLGKPFAEDELLALVANYARRMTTA
jgi:chemosensory pili system protein ChpA (sensor histidine kinase/response regulator)